MSCNVARGCRWAFNYVNAVTTMSSTSCQVNRVRFCLSLNLTRLYVSRGTSHLVDSRRTIFNEICSSQKDKDLQTPHFSFPIWFNQHQNSEWFLYINIKIWNIPYFPYVSGNYKLSKNLRINLTNSKVKIKYHAK